MSEQQEMNNLKVGVNKVNPDVANGIQKAFRRAEEEIKSLPGKKVSESSEPEVEQADKNSLDNVSPQQLNGYRSASELMQAISQEAVRWRDNLPSQYRPAILAILHGGIQINVHSLSQISFHGIRIAGEMNGAPCAMFAHQSTVQLLCFAEEIVEETPNNPIGFIWPGHSVEV